MNIKAWWCNECQGLLNFTKDEKEHCCGTCGRSAEPLCLLSDLTKIIAHIPLKKGDVGVLETDERIPEDARVRMTAAWSSTFPGTTLLVLSDGLKLTAILSPTENSDEPVP